MKVRFYFVKGTSGNTN